MGCLLLGTHYLFCQRYSAWSLIEPITLISKSALIAELEYLTGEIEKYKFRQSTIIDVTQRTNNWYIMIHNLEMSQLYHVIFSEFFVSPFFLQCEKNWCENHTELFPSSIIQGNFLLYFSVVKLKSFFML